MNGLVNITDALTDSDEQHIKSKIIEHVKRATHNFTISTTIKIHNHEFSFRSTMGIRYEIMTKTDNFDRYLFAIDPKFLPEQDMFDIWIECMVYAYTRDSNLIQDAIMSIFNNDVDRFNQLSLTTDGFLLFIFSSFVFYISNKLYNSLFYRNTKHDTIELYNHIIPHPLTITATTLDIKLSYNDIVYDNPPHIFTSDAINDLATNILSDYLQVHS